MKGEITYTRGYPEVKHKIAIRRDFGLWIWVADDIDVDYKGDPPMPVIFGICGNSDGTLEDAIRDIDEEIDELEAE